MDPQPAQAASPGIELVSQTPTVSRGGSFEARVRLPDVPQDGSLELILHGRVRSRSELAASMEGNALRSQIYNVTTPIAALPVAQDGSRRILLSLDPSAPGGIALTSAGVYPVEIEVRSAAGESLAALVTHLLVRPNAADESPPLAVAVVAHLDQPPALRPDGTVQLADADIARANDLVEALAATARVEATLALRPETVEALASSGEPAAAALLDRLRVAAEERSTLALPYVDASPDALVDAGLEAELDEQLERGRLVLSNTLGVRPTLGTWIAQPDLDLPGLAALRSRGVRNLVVAPEQLEPLRSGVLSLSLAQRFVIDSDDESEIDAIALDQAVLDRIGTPETPGLEVSRLLAELALLWFEQPGIARAIVVPVDTSTRAEVVQGLLSGLASGNIFEPVDLDGAFEAASALRQPGGGRVDRALVPDEARSIRASLAREVLPARELLSTFRSVIGSDNPLSEVPAAHLLLATASRLSDADRSAHLDAAVRAIESVTTAITAPTHATITLTARDGTVPLTVRNDTGMPVDVVIHLRSTKLEFPAGATIPLTLTEPTTRLDIAVRARVSGSFPLDVTITSPDGALTLAAVDYSVQSTAISGVGLVLSVGAAIFLLIWWARHWRRTRRSRKLVSSTHPAHISGARDTTALDADSALQQDDIAR